MRKLFLAGWLAGALAAQTKLEDLARGLRELEFDPDRCYRVRDLLLQKEDAKIFLTDGYLTLSKPIGGGPIAAVFTAEVEGGEAEILMLPPTRGERMSLASFIETPNLEERFRNAVFLFTDDTGAELEKRIAGADPAYRTSTEMGLVLKQRYESVVRNLGASFQVRVLQDLLAAERREKGFFYAALGGARMGNFDLFVDQRGRKPLTLGQVVSLDQGGAVFNIWTQFEGRAWRERPAAQRQTVRWDPVLDDFRIEAEIGADLMMKAVTRVKATVREGGEGALAFEISQRMKITGAKIDGEPVLVYQRESFRSVLMAGGQNELILLVPPKPLEPGRLHEVEIAHEGNVIRDAGNGVFYVLSRSNWYPQRGLQMARYDVRFKVPKGLTLVSSGDPQESALDGEWQTSRWVTPLPVRLLGFNLGKFERSSQTRGAYKIDVYANPSLEKALTPQAQIMAPMPPPTMPRGPRRGMEVPVLAAPMPPSPLARLERMAGELAETLDFMAGKLGAPALKTINVTPIPGRFGQGFPGLLYLSTLAYLDPRYQGERPANEAPGYFEILQAHEVAHQWWGNVVTPGSTEDEWLMEALANYTALLYYEKKKGAKALDAVLGTYRDHLLVKNPEGKTLEAAGPIIWGTRLANSQTPGAWQAITYEKGTWILHMLRRRMGETAFFQMLAELTKRFALAPLTNGDVQALAMEVAPAEARKSIAAFFDTWVYGTGMPELTLVSKVNATARTVSGTITQKQVDEDFSVEVPVEIQLGRGKPLTQWVKTSSDGAEFSVKLPPGVLPAQVKVTLDPNRSLLRR